MKAAKDLTKGSVVSGLILFALPILLSNVLQALYSIIDMIIVGQCVGSAGMSAISIGGQITYLVLVIALGFSNGGSVLIGNLFGSGKMNEARRVVSTLVCFLALCAIAVSILVAVFSNPLINILDTPAASRDQTLSYLRLCMIGTVFIYVYNALYASLRGIGQSLWPMIIVVITTGMNVVLDLVFVAVLSMDVTGAALATVLSQVTSAVLMLWYCCKKTELMSTVRSFFTIHLPDLVKILRVGLPQCIQFVITNLSFLLIVSLINSYGVIASAAAGAANKVWTFGVIPGQSMMSAMVSMCAQNMPGRNYGRIYKGLGLSIAVSCGIGVVLMVLCWVVPDAIYGLFTTEQAVKEMGRMFLGYYSICFITENLLFCLYGMLTGAGYTTVTMTCSILSSVCVRYTLALVYSRFTPLGFDGIALSYPSAAVVSICIAAGFLISGRWKISRIERVDEKIRRKRTVDNG